MKTVKLSGANIHYGSLILVNPSWPVKAQPGVDSLSVVDGSGDSVLLERQAARVLAKTLSEIGGIGRIAAVSGYRTMHEQQRLYEACLRDKGEDFTRRYVAIPGCSEHQTGLAVDLSEDASPEDMIRPNFPYSGICQLFRQKAADFGFIERYPADAQLITHIAHEPWHFRYVGYPHSRIIKNRGFALEEYTGYLRRFHYHEERLKFSENGLKCEIGFVPLRLDAAAEVEVPEHMAYQLSGNNVDGMVVTLWELR